MRKNTKTVVKTYDTQEVNGWLVNYEYESQDNAAPSQIIANAVKAGTNLSIVKAGTNTSVSFTGADFDGIVVQAISDEFSVIHAGFAQ